MITLLQNIFNLFGNEAKKKELQGKLDEEQRKFDEALANEENDSSSMQVQNAIGISRTNEENPKIKKSNCFKRTGIISTLRSNHGTIDHGIFFDIDVARNLNDELAVGVRVTYLAYQEPDSDYIKVIKIEEVINDYWEEGVPSEEQMHKQIEELQKEEPKYFGTHRRNIFGIITERVLESVFIDAEYTKIKVNLDNVHIDFVPKEGDRVIVECNVQSDDDLVDYCGEIIDTIAIQPVRRERSDGCIVTRLHVDGGGILDPDCYFTSDILSSDCKLNVGDRVSVEKIECLWNNFNWRCIKLELVERAAVSSILPSAVAPTRRRTEKQQVSVSDNVRCVFPDLSQRQQVELIVTNNSDRVQVARRLQFESIKSNSQMTLIEPNLDGFKLNPGEQQVIRIEITPRFYGANREKFLIIFTGFKIVRSIEVVVSEDSAPDDQRIRSFNRNSRKYADQIWSRKTEVTPGIGIGHKKRFVTQRIGFFEVPERLRTAYLTTNTKAEMETNILGMFPCLQNDLTFMNYVPRFQTLIHLEEIEYYVNMRRYDQERVHFTRDGEFLSLTIKNLAEKRPSLVLGDTVRAINPWIDEEAKTQSYDGVIHKVLFDRVLLKFNEGFQSKYNGEDYKVEFYFSRFGFRKQHFSVNRLLQQMPEPRTFLFPTKITLRDKPQLDVKLDNKINLLIANANSTSQQQPQWFNDKLNLIQKKAIVNVLRCEANGMAYVIFGPPGTGKTITLVETIMQLVKLLPNSRLLVGTPSNSSADLIATRLIESEHVNPGDFIRLVSQNLIEKELIPKHLAKYCATADIAIDGSTKNSMITTESGLKLKCQMKYLGQHRVTISTCSTLGTFLQMGFSPTHFTHVIIDEAAQCSEPEVMQAISQVSNRGGQVILAGDPYQLNPVIINKYAAGLGLEISFLDRLLKTSPYQRDIIRFPNTSGFNPRLVTKLIYNYRALPSILSLYNDLFYDSELRPMVADTKDTDGATLLRQINDLLPESESRSKTHATFFHGVRGENKQDAESPSWYNAIEARTVFMLTINMYRKKVTAERIGIITPYQKQVRVIRSLFQEADITMPKIGSVEEFQGQERDIILISTVRSSMNYISSDVRYSLGFVQSSKRMNVAISRARYLLFVCGNPHMLILDNCWRTLIKYCIDNDAYMGCDLPMSLNPLENGNGVKE